MNDTEINELSKASAGSDEDIAIGLVTIAVAACAVLVAVAAATWVLPSYFEAKAYNRLTGASATTWDAMWVQLRVQNDSK